MQRRKGASGERELAGLLREQLGLEVTRNLEQCRSGGCDLLGLEGWSPEVKRAARPRIAEWWAQCCAQAAADGNRPVLFYRLDRAKFGLDARRAQDEAERAGVRDQYLNNLSATQAHKATLESAGLEQKGTLLKAYLDAQNPQNRKARLADLFAWYGRQPPESFDELQ